MIDDDVGQRLGMMSCISMRSHFDKFERLLSR